MKQRIFGFVFVAACWLSFPRNASATLDSGCFAAHYSSYTSTDLGSDHASLIQTVQVSGYTEALNPAVYMGPQLGWQYPCTNQTNQMQSSTHTSNIRNVVGSTGGNYSQGPTPALSYNNYVVSITAPATHGTIYSSETNTEVICQVAGSIFLWPIWSYIEIAYTREQSTGVTSNCYWLTGPLAIMDCSIASETFCTPASTPPDMHISPTEWQVYPIPPPSFWDTIAPCGRLSTSGSWHCGHGFSTPYSVAIGATPQPGFCDRNP